MQYMGLTLGSELSRPLVVGAVLLDVQSEHRTAGTQINFIIHATKTNTQKW